jgi:molybdate transport system ATP-binding protein
MTDHAMNFDVAIRLRRGDFETWFAFASAAPVTALLGPSGVGKTSVLLAIAGLVRPVSGHVRIAGRTLFDSAAGIDLPPRDRGLGIVFQDSRLFPHLTVRANLAYAGRADAAAVATMAARLGVAPLLDRWPRNLSGGEVRRVALGRALLARPTALLLDEPLTNIDAQRSSALLELLTETAKAQPVLYVTHELSEAVALQAGVVTLQQTAEKLPE